MSSMHNYSPTHDVHRRTQTLALSHSLDIRSADCRTSASRNGTSTKLTIEIRTSPHIPSIHVHTGILPCTSAAAIYTPHYHRPVTFTNH